MGNLSHKSGGRTEKADFRSLPTNKTQKGARESRNDIKSYGTLYSFIRPNKMVVINIPVQLRADSKLHPSAAGEYPSGGIIATHCCRTISRFLQQPRYDGPYHKSCGRTVSLSVLRDLHKLLHSAFEQAVLWEYISRNPFHRAVLPRMETKPRQFLRPDQISVLLEQCDNPRLALAIHLAFARSLRRGEILALTWQDVDWKRSAIRINKTLCRVSQEALRTLGEQNILFEFPPVLKSDKTVLVLKSPKTVSSNRIIYLPEAVMRLLKEHLNRQQEEGTADPIMVFQDKDGHPLQDTTLIKYFQSALQCASLPKVCFHSLRHSSITYKLVLSRGDIKSVQGDSGHAQAEMVTEIYSHVLDENRRKNMLLFEQEFYQNYGTV